MIKTKVLFFFISSLLLTREVIAQTYQAAPDDYWTSGVRIDSDTSYFNTGNDTGRSSQLFYNTREGRISQNPVLLYKFSSQNNRGYDYRLYGVHRGALERSLLSTDTKTGRGLPWGIPANSYSPPQRPANYGNW